MPDPTRSHQPSRADGGRSLQPRVVLETTRSTSPRLLTQLREALRVRHLSRRTEQAYVWWVRRFVRFHGLQHPATLGAAEVRAFLTHLAVEGRVSARSNESLQPTAGRVEIAAPAQIPTKSFGFAPARAAAELKR